MNGRCQCEHLGYPCALCEREAEDHAALADEPDDDTREHDQNYTREYGDTLTRGGW